MRPSKRAILQHAIIASALLVPSTIWATDLVRLKVGHTGVLELSRTATILSVGNADIANATVAFGDKVVVTGKTPGTTNVIALDESGRIVRDATVSVVRADGRRTINMVASGRQRTYVCSPTPGCLVVDPATQLIEYEQTSDAARVGGTVDR
jgi:Flp pilus assembly secretin CpaC